MVLRIPELNPKARDRQSTLFDTHRFHAFFITVPADVLDTVAADKTHGRHAIIEQVNADLKDSALAHLPSGNFAANSAWLACAVRAHNLTRAAGLLAAGPIARAAPPRSGPSSSTSPGSPPAPERSGSTSQRPGPDRTPGNACSQP